MLAKQIVLKETTENAWTNKPEMDLHRCPVRATVNVLRGKWKPLILYFLKGGQRRYGDLRGQLKGASEKVLVEQLRQLEQDGVVQRVVYPEVPPRVEYLITTYGYTLIPVLQQMADWGAGHRERRGS